MPAQVRFVDVPGATSAQGLAELRVTDALAVVLRAFGPDADPASDWRKVTDELVLADLAVVDSALENARRRAKGRSGGGGPEVASLERRTRRCRRSGCCATWRSTRTTSATSGASPR